MNWEKFKSLKLSEKLQWILQYYGLTIGVAAAAIFVGAVFLISVFGPGDDYAVRVMILDDRLSSDACRVFSEELGGLLSGECDITGYAETGAEQMQAFIVRLMTDELDLIIAPTEIMDELAQNEYLRGAAALGADSRYHMYTSGSERTEISFSIGQTARSKKTDHISEVIDYFNEKI